MSRTDTNASQIRSRGDMHRQRVLDAARAMFAKHGFHPTTVAQIADACGLSVGQIYRQFESKEDIIAAVASADVAGWLEEGLAFAVAEGDHCGSREWVRRFVSLEPTVNQARILSEIIAEAGRSERIAEIFRTIATRSQEGLAEVLATIAPGPNCADARARLVEMISILRLGIAVRHALGHAGEMAVNARQTGEIIDRELDQLEI